ncbi:MAG TPA: hypothetical protein PK864_10740 [Syntrophorhabdaceae bacterium]|nr:hypothetical protein [Syntrophorhabdaceae bacterium]HOL05200.1 hypothetical protein [Syntrophorhabdaceae bacterium]HON86482.1 hypothetical protein [Syntrophorhabdaceae bacterium]HOT42933.1 hypothetical protein [Syntrophorhabdaceae bacterium]HPC66306.1 hypothetical protein [Syntrophorhabdaceae bacterium]
MGDSDGSRSCNDMSQEHPSEEHDDPGSLAWAWRPVIELITSNL